MKFIIGFKTLFVIFDVMRLLGRYDIILNKQIKKLNFGTNYHCIDYLRRNIKKLDFLKQMLRVPLTKLLPILSTIYTIKNINLKIIIFSVIIFKF